jgi:Phosphoesterase family
MGVNWLNMSKTIYELLAENKLDSRIYYHDSTMAMTFKGLMNQGRYFGLIDDFLSDCKKDRLPAYSFIEPRYANGEDPSTNSFFSASDQHPDHNVEDGEILIRDVFNAVWGSPARNSTLLVIVYDEHGGLYDHVSPPTAPNPDGHKWDGNPNSLDPPFDFTRLGVRVPAVLVSPYIETGTIDRTVYDHGSLAATACKVFLKDVPNAFLTDRDRQANTFERNLTRAQARDEQISLSPMAARPALLPAMAAAHLNGDINDHLRKLVEATSFVEKQVLPPSEQSGIDPHDIRVEWQASAYMRKTHAKLRAAARKPAGVARGGAGTD